MLNVSSVGEVYTNELLKRPLLLLVATYRRLAGLYIIQTSGERNDDVTFLLRGQAPLVMIDGTPQSFVSINPEQIES